jgi:hypothetical protein
MRLPNHSSQPACGAGAGLDHGRLLGGKRIAQQCRALLVDAEQVGDEVNSFRQDRPVVRAAPARGIRCGIDAVE